MHLSLEASFDSTQSNRSQFRRFFGAGYAGVVETRLVERLKSELEQRAERGGFIELQVTPQSATPDTSVTHRLQAIARINGDEEILFEATLRSNDGVQVRHFQAPVLLPQDFGLQWSDLEKEATRPGAGGDPSAPVAQLFSEELVGLVAENLYRWLFASTVRFRVGVAPFINLGPDTLDYGYLTQSLATYVRTELAGSLALSVLGATAQGDQHYTIQGEFSVVDGGMRIDISCIKQPDGRVLTSSFILVDRLDLPTLSEAVSRLTRRMSWAMESDFRLETKSLVVAGVVDSRARSGGVISDEDLSMATEVVRAVSRKFGLLTLGNGPDDRVVNLAVRSAESQVQPASDFDPLSTLMANEADYLVLVGYGDLGDRVRLSAQLFFFDPDHPGSAEPVNDNGTLYGIN